MSDAEYRKEYLPGASDQKITWRKRTGGAVIYEAYVKDPRYRGGAEHMAGWIEYRPHYCDRGHFKAMVEVINLDSADAFPRYFMRFATAVQEMEEFISWRLWGVRARTSEATPDIFMAATLRILE
jgi:hypothetical protein